MQHLLTERLFRKIFDNQEFTRRNVIAAEVEKVIDALVSQSFNRDEFLQDRSTASTGPSRRPPTPWRTSREKQHFLNTVYERFFQGYSVKVADTHGIVYTPQAIVDFMCASVAEVLETRVRPDARLARREHPRPLHRHRQLHRQPAAPHPQEGPAARLPRAALRQRGHAAAVLHRGAEHRARLLRTDRAATSRSRGCASWTRWTWPKAATDERSVHDGGEHGARRAAEEDADYRHHRQSAVQRRAAERERQQQEPQVSR